MKVIKEELNNMSLSSRFIEVNELRKMRWKEHAARLLIELGNQSSNNHMIRNFREKGCYDVGINMFQ